MLLLSALFPPLCVYFNLSVSVFKDYVAYCQQNFMYSVGTAEGLILRTEPVAVGDKLSQRAEDGAVRTELLVRLLFILNT